MWSGFGEPYRFCCQLHNTSKFRPISDLVLSDTLPRGLFLSSWMRSNVSSFDNMRQFWLLSYPHVLVHDRQTCFNLFDTLVARWLAPKVPAPLSFIPPRGSFLPIAPHYLLLLPVILVGTPHRYLLSIFFSLMA